MRARGADLRVVGGGGGLGGLMRTRSLEPTRGVRGHVPPGKLESSEMARNGSKTAKIEVNF